MRTTILATLMATMLVPVAAQAQNPELRRDRQEIREQRHDTDRGTRHPEADRDARDRRGEVREARRDHREDWRDHRRNNRDAYHRSAYVGPRGYRYRPVAIGHRFDRAYYGQRYWVSDYARYRLPAPGYNRRWVRYGNDIVLVNVRNGNVIAVNQGFFW